MTSVELNKKSGAYNNNPQISVVAARLKDYLKSLGLSQSMIAHHMNCAQPYVNQLLTGKRPIGKQTAAKFQELYGVSAAWLLTGLGEMIIDQSKVCHDNSTLEVAAQLKDYLKSLGLSQTMIANQMNCAPSYVNQLLAGKNPIGKQTAAKFQELYGISAAWLLTGDGEMIIDPSKVPPIVDDAHNKVRARMEKAMIKDNKVSGQNIIVGNGNEMQTKSSNDEIAALKARVAQLEEENRWLRSVVESGMIKK